MAAKLWDQFNSPLQRAWEIPAYHPTINYYKYLVLTKDKWLSYSQLRVASTYKIPQCPVALCPLRTFRGLELFTLDQRCR